MTVTFCRAPGCFGPGGGPHLAADWLCPECDRLARCIVAEAGVLYLAVREQIVPGSSGRDERRASSPAARLPLRADMFDLAQESVRLFTQWSEIVTGGHHEDPKPHTDRAFARALSVLLERHDEIVHSRVGPAYAGDLRRWANKVRRATGMTSRPERIAVPCPVCDLRGLMWYPSEAELRCIGCGITGEPLVTRGLLALLP